MKRMNKTKQPLAAELQAVQKTMSSADYREWVIHSALKKDPEAQKFVAKTAGKCRLFGEDFYEALWMEWERLMTPDSRQIGVRCNEIEVYARSGTEYLLCTGYTYDEPHLVSIPEANGALYALCIREEDGSRLYAGLSEPELTALCTNATFLSQLSGFAAKPFHEKTVAVLIAEKLLRTSGATRDRKLQRERRTAKGAVYSAIQRTIDSQTGTRGNVMKLWTREFARREAEA